MTDKKINPLPRSEDEYWEGGMKVPMVTIPFPMCQTHTKDNYLTHFGYVDNKDGTVSCTKCSWGFRLPGYLRIHEGKVFDLRSS